jgi:MinD-like ATPase involved in chromosome partitioning or flagellar assembly
VSPPAELRRREGYPGTIVDGRRADAAAARWRRHGERLLVSKGEREEAQLEAQLLGGQQAVSRANVVAVISPNERVGKTTCAFVVGNLIADRRRQRVVAVDTNPDLGTLAALASKKARCARSVADLLTDIEQIHTTVDIRRYMSALPSGLDLLAAPSDPETLARLGPDAYGEALALLSVFYELVILDLGKGTVGPIARFAIERADQLVVVTTPESVSSSLLLAALEQLQDQRTTVATNMLYARGPSDIGQLERRLRERGVRRSVVIPYDRQLAGMLDTGTYQLDALERPTRVAIKRLGLAVAEQFV